MVSDLMREQVLVTLPADASVEAALKSLAARRVLSAPVTAPPPGTPFPPGTTAEFKAAAAERGSLVCHCDLRDILWSFLETLGPEAEALAGARLLKRMKVLEEAGATLAATPLAALPVLGTDGVFMRADTAAGLSVGDLLDTVMLHPPDLAAVRPGSAPRARAAAHRVALTSPDGRAVTHVVSQLDVARWLLSRVACLGPLAGRTLAEAGWADRGVVCVRPDTPAIDALATMRAHGIAGLAIVDPDSGAMIGSFALPDLRSLASEHLGALALPAAEFLARSRGREFWGVAAPVAAAAARPALPDGEAPPAERRRPASGPGGGGGGGGPDFPPPPAGGGGGGRRASIGDRVGQAVVTASGSDTVTAALARLVSRRVHRLHIVDASDRPTGVVTLTDVLQAVLGAAQAQTKAQEQAQAGSDGDGQAGGGGVTGRDG
jgi:CBS domain-containing protein